MMRNENPFVKQCVCALLSSKIAHRNIQGNNVCHLRSQLIDLILYLLFRFFLCLFIQRVCICNYRFDFDANECQWAIYPTANDLVDEKTPRKKKLWENVPSTSINMSFALFPLRFEILARAQRLQIFSWGRMMKEVPSLRNACNQRTVVVVWNLFFCGRHKIAQWELSESMKCALVFARSATPIQSDSFNNHLSPHRAIANDTPLTPMDSVNLFSLWINGRASLKLTCTSTLYTVQSYS